MSDIGLSMRLFHQAVEAGVTKIVLASTNHVSGMNELKYNPPRLCTLDQQRPDSWYGAMKGMAETAGRYLVDSAAICFIAIRIGSFSGQTEPSSLRLCSTLLTPRDCVQLFGLALDYEGPKNFLVVYGASNNRDGEYCGFLDISSAIDELGYQPNDYIARYRQRFES